MTLKYFMTSEKSLNHLFPINFGHKSTIQIKVPSGTVVVTHLFVKKNSN